MTRSKRDAQAEFERWIDFMVEDIEAMSDEAVRGELVEAYGTIQAADAVAARALAGARRAQGMARLAAAKAALGTLPAPAAARGVDGAAAKDAVLRYWAQHPSEVPVTLAARHGQGLSENDALALYQSLVDLGLIEELPHAQ